MSAFSHYINLEANKNFKDWTTYGLTHLLSYEEISEKIKKKINTKLSSLK